MVTLSNRLQYSTSWRRLILTFFSPKWTESLYRISSALLVSTSHHGEMQFISLKLLGREKNKSKQFECPPRLRFLLVAITRAFTGCCSNTMTWWCPTFLATGIGFVEDSFSTNQAGVRGRMVWGRFKCITFIVYFIIITSAPPQIIRYQILEVEDPCYNPWASLMS